MRVQHNIAAMNSYRNYGNNTKAINKNLEKLSSGYKINRAGDDAAGLAISEKMRAQITGLEGAQKNAKDGISLVQTAEGALTEVHSMLNRMYSLAEQSANGTYDSDTDRYQLQKEVDKLRTEIDRIADSSNFNGIKLLNGGLGGREVEITGDELKANGVQKLIAEGGDGSALSSTQKLKATSTATGNITLTWSDSSADDVKGITWQVASGPDAGKANGTWDTASDGYAGSVTFKAVVDYKNADLRASSATRFDGMTVTVQVGAADSTGAFNAATHDELVLGQPQGLTLQIGDTADSYNQLNVSINSIKVDALSLNTVDISSASAAQSSMATIKAAINYVSDVRGTLGATQNRLEHTINNLSVMQENIQDAESTIRDTDVAAEMMKYTKNSILVQSAQAMLAQANQQPQGVLQLLQ
jgi:flagellin